MSFSGDATHEPSPRRRQEARDEGRIPKSGDLARALVLLSGVVGLIWVAPMLGERLKLMLQASVTSVTVDAKDTHWMAKSAQHLQVLVLITGGYLLFLMFMGCVSNWMQTGFQCLPGKVLPSFQRLNASYRTGIFFSSDGAYRIAMALISLALGGLVFRNWIWMSWTSLASASPCLEVALPIVLSLFVRLLLILVVGQVVLGVSDYFVQRWRHERSLLMTDSEKREEVKSIRNDPAIRSRRRWHQTHLANESDYPGE